MRHTEPSTEGAEAAPTPGWGGLLGPPGLCQGSDGYELPSGCLELAGSPQAAAGRALLAEQRVSHAPGTGSEFVPVPASDMINGLISAAFTAPPDTRSRACTQVPSPGCRASSDSYGNKQRKGSGFSLPKQTNRIFFWSGLQHPGETGGEGLCADVIPPSPCHARGSAALGRCGAPWPKMSLQIPLPVGARHLAAKSGKGWGNALFNGTFINKKGLLACIPPETLIKVK